MSKSKGKGKVKTDGRARRDGGKEREWRGLIERQRRSGESVRAFCRSKRLHEASFYYWRREIGLRDREAASSRKTPPVLAPVVFVDEPRGNSDQPREACMNGLLASLEIVLGGGTTVRVGPDSTPEQLAVVLGVLGQARC